MEKIVIAGGTSGIGFAAAKLLLDKGYFVTIVGRNEYKLETALDNLGQNADGKIVDASNRTEIEIVLSEVGVFNHLQTEAGAADPSQGTGIAVPVIRH